MKSLVNYIVESQTNGTVKGLFDDIDKKLANQEWDEVAPIIENIFKNKWGKPIKLDDNFDDKMRYRQYLLLGYNIKSKVWIICFYNSRNNCIYGCLYTGSYIREIGRGPEFWSNVPGWIKDDKMKLRYADAYAEESRAVINGISSADYNYKDE